MRTYIFTETNSCGRDYNKTITVHRIKRNRPHLIGVTYHSTASWRGARGEAVTIIHEEDGIPYAIKENGSVDRYTLRGLLTPATMYDDVDYGRRSIRLFGV